METVAEQAERRFRALVEHSMDITLVLDAEGSILYASPSAARLLGYAFDDWQGRSAFAAVHPDDQVQVSNAFLGIVGRAGQTVPLVFRVRKSDGTFLHAEAVATNRIDDSAVGGVVINLRDTSERVRAELQARVIDERHRALVSSLAEGVLMADADGVAVLCNEALEQMLGIPATRLVGRTLLDIVAAAKRNGNDIVDDEERSLAVEEHPVIVSWRTGVPMTGKVSGILRPGRAPLWLQINARKLVEGDGGPTGVVASFADVTEVRAATSRLQRASGALQQERNFLQVLLDNLEEGIVACDAAGRITMMNPASGRFFGVSAGDLLGRPLSPDGMRQLDGSAMAAEETPLARALRGESVREAQLIVESRHGEHRTVAANAQVLRDETGRELGAVVALHDVTEHKRTEERLAELALHDPLTSVANRLLLDDRLRRALDRMRRGGGGVGVFLLDLDDFKAVNDMHGHDVGDEVLCAAAQRLLAATRPEDTVARLGGDEFVVVCEVSGGLPEVQIIADRIERALAEPYRLTRTTLSVSASVGGVLVETPGVEPSKVISQADDEMYRVKSTRRQARLQS